MPNGIEFPMVLLVSNLTLILSGGGELELFDFLRKSDGAALAFPPPA